MTDERTPHGYSGHGRVHGWAPDSPIPVMELDGVPTVVSIDRDEAVLWICDLRGGECVNRPLDLAAVGPDDDEFVWKKSRMDAPWVIAERMAVSHLNGQPVVVTGGARRGFSSASEGMVRAWDLRTGQRIGKVMVGHDLGICSLTTVLYDRGTLSVSSCETGKLLAWDLATGERVAEIQGSYNGGMGAALIDGRPVAVTGGHDDFLQVWDILAGEQIGKPLTGIEPVARALAITKVGDRAVVLAGGDDTAVHMWDLATQEPIGEPLAGHTDSIQTLDTATVGSRTIAVTGNHDSRRGDGTTRVWDLARGEQIGEPLVGHHLQMVTQIAGTPVLVTTDDDDAIWLWDLAQLVRYFEGEAHYYIADGRDF